MMLNNLPKITELISIDSEAQIPNQKLEPRLPSSTAGIQGHLWQIIKQNKTKQNGQKVHTR